MMTVLWALMTFYQPGALPPGTSGVVVPTIGMQYQSKSQCEFAAVQAARTPGIIAYCQGKLPDGQVINVIP